MFRDVKRFVEAHAGRESDPPLGTGRVLALDAANRDIDGCCYLFFDERGQPRYVAKAARTAAGQAVFETEFRVLEELDRRGLNADAPAAPRPLCMGYEAGTMVALQSALVGCPMKNLPARDLTSRRAVGRTFDMVLAWWKRFQDRLGIVPLRLTPDRYTTKVLEPVALFRSRFRLDAEETAFLERRFEVERRLLDVELPFMARHADFCAANMIVTERGIGLIDWEFPLSPETPLFDLFFFFSSVRFSLGCKRGESSHFRSFESVFWEESYFQDEMRHRLKGVCETYGIEPSLLADLFVLSLVQVANMKYQGLIDSHGIREGAVESRSDRRKAERWASFRRPDKDAPFACIRGGVFENIRLVVRRGIPDLAAEG